MDIQATKLDLMQKLLMLDSEEVLNKVKELLNKTESDFTLTQAQKRILDERRTAHLSGESKSYSWEEVRAKARAALK